MREKNKKTLQTERKRERERERETDRQTDRQTDREKGVGESEGGGGGVDFSGAVFQPEQ